MQKRQNPNGSAIGGGMREYFLWCNHHRIWQRIRRKRERERRRPKSYKMQQLVFGLRIQIEREKIKIEINTRPDAFFPGVVLLRYTCCTSFQLGWWGCAVILLIMNNAPQCLSRSEYCVRVLGPRSGFTTDTRYIFYDSMLFFLTEWIF